MTEINQEEQALQAPQILTIAEQRQIDVLGDRLLATRVDDGDIYGREDRG